MGLLIGPGIAGGVSVLGAATFTFGGNLGGAKLILVAKVIGALVVVDVFVTSPLVSFAVPFVSFVIPFVSFVLPLVVPLLNGFFVGAEIGRLKGLDKPLVSGCLLTKVDVRGVVFVFDVVDDFVVKGVLGVVGVLGDDVGVVLVKEERGVVNVVFAEVGRDAGIVVLGAGFGAAFVTVVVFKVVFGTVVGRTLPTGLEVDDAVVGLDSGFDVVDEVVFLRIGADVFGVNGFVEGDFAVGVLALETVVSIFFGADFLEVKQAPVTAAIAAVPTAAATAISATWNLVNY